MWSYAAHNSCMKLHISELFFTSDSFYWKLARFLLVAMPPLIGFCALACFFRHLTDEKNATLKGPIALAPSQTAHRQQDPVVEVIIAANL